MKTKFHIIICLCLLLAAMTACGKGESPDTDGNLSKYVEFRAVTGYYEGREYTVDLPYLIGEADNVIARSENKNVDMFAEKIRNSTQEEGYFVDVSCVLVDDSVVSMRLKGDYETAYGPSGEVWATNYNVTDGTSTSVATSEFPHSANYEAWLQSHIMQTYQAPSNGELRIYNFHVPYVYYMEDDRLMAAVVFTQLRDGGESWQAALDIDITDGPQPYFTATEMENIAEMLLEPAELPPLEATEEQVNDEYGITISYWDNHSNDFTYQLFALGQMNPAFPDIFNSLKQQITFEDDQIHGSDYTKVYTFSDNFGRDNFVIKTQFWGEKDWIKGVERVCYVGVDFVDGAIAGTIRGPGFMSEDELLVRYPHDLSIATDIIPDAHLALNMSKPTKAYIYKDPNDYSNRDLAFIVKNGQVVSVDAAASYEYSRYDGKLGHSQPLSQMNNQASALEVKTASSFKNKYDVLEVLPAYPDAEMWTGDERMITVDINAPRVSAAVPDSERINGILAGFQSEMVRVAEELKKGNLRALAEGDLLGHLSLDYDVYNYKNAAALVVEAKGYIFHGGGGNSYLIVYYDCDTGNVMTPRQYLTKCGVTEESVLGKWAGENHAPLFPEDLMVKTIYDVKFAIDGSGNAMLFEELSD